MLPVLVKMLPVLDKILNIMCYCFCVIMHLWTAAGNGGKAPLLVPFVYVADPLWLPCAFHVYVPDKLPTLCGCHVSFMCMFPTSCRPFVVVEKHIVCLLFLLIVADISK